MNYRTLFDTDEVTTTVAPIARHSDPITSQQSAAETEKKLGTLHQSFLCGLSRLSPHAPDGSCTANEVAAHCAELDGGMAESYRKRAKELVDAGLIEQAGERRCEITGKSAMTFRAKGQT